MGSPGSLPPSHLTVHQSLASFIIKRPLPHIKVGRRLLHFFVQWSQVTSNQYILNIIKQGVTLSFDDLPYSTTNLASLSSQPVFSSRPGRNLAQLSSNIQEMLQKSAIEKVTKKSPGFYSHLFLVPKKTSDLRLIINLKLLNNHITTEKSKMETQRAIRKALTQGDWVTSTDLRDAYFHIPVRPTARKYLHFTQGPLLQPDLCAKRILQSHGDSGSHISLPKHQSSHIPGRLAPQSQIVPTMLPIYCNNTAPNQQPRIHHQ